VSIDGTRRDGRWQRQPWPRLGGVGGRVATDSRRRPANDVESPVVLRQVDRLDYEAYLAGLVNVSHVDDRVDGVPVRLTMLDDPPWRVLAVHYRRSVDGKTDTFEVEDGANTGQSVVTT
jgi:hypothetical protein